MVVAQLAERSLRTQEVSGFVCKICIDHLFTVNCIEKTNVKITEAGNGPLKRTKDCFEPFVLDAFIKVGQSRMFVYFIFLLIS